jgi:hypothetical protein
MLFTAVAALVAAAPRLLVSGRAVGADIPQIGGVVNYVASSGAVHVNGVPVTEFSAGEGGSGGTSMNFTDWMVNGPNEIVLTVEPVNDSGWAKLEVQEFTSDGPVFTLEQNEKGEARGTFEAEGLPEWAWLRATPQDEAAGLEDEVSAFHEAFAGADMDKIIAMSRPFLADQEIASGLTTEIFREELGPILEEGTLKELPALSIAGYLDGRLFRVKGPDGGPPINLEFESEGMSGAVRAGEWWSMIEGEWRVIR